MVYYYFGDAFFAIVCDFFAIVLRLFLSLRLITIIFETIFWEWFWGGCSSEDYLWSVRVCVWRVRTLVGLLGLSLSFFNS